LQWNTYKICVTITIYVAVDSFVQCFDTVG